MPIRSFRKEDIPRVADLYQRLLLTEAPSRRNLPASALPDYLEKIIFHNPWYDEELPSMVFEDAAGKVIGFLGVIPRRLLLRDQPIRAAMSFHLMVEPENRSSLAAVQLVKKFFSGPQDFSFTDGAGGIGARIWEGVGGKTSLLYSQRWMRLLRPSQFLLEQVGKQGALSPILRAINPIARLADNVVSSIAPGHFSNGEVEGVARNFDIETILDTFPQLARTRVIQPVYDQRSLQWLLDQAGQVIENGALQKVLVLDPQGAVAGWYLYHVKSRDLGMVIQLVMRKDAAIAVLDHLFHHARQSGVSALTGRLDPQYMQEMADKRCYFRRAGPLMCIHSNNADILNIIQRGDAFLSVLDGEWSLLF